MNLAIVQCYTTNAVQRVHLRMPHDGMFSITTDKRLEICHLNRLYNTEIEVCVIQRMAKVTKVGMISILED